MITTELMKIAIKAGEIMLTSGAEIFRVEETIVRICESYDIECESFVLPTGIFISIIDESGNAQTSFKRIKQRTVNLNRIDSVNTFSRGLKASPMEYDAAMQKLDEIEKEKQYSMPAVLLAAAVGSFVFAVLFNGSSYDGIAAAIISIIVFLLKGSLHRKGFFPFFELFATGLFAGIFSVAACRFFPVLNESRIIIGAVTLYLPGVAITNGIKDAFYGDLVASSARLGEAFLTATALAAGVGIAIALGMNLG